MTFLPEHAQRRIDRAIDYSGHTIAGVYVDRPGGILNGARKYHCVCPCGAKFTAAVSNLRGYDERGYPAGCKACTKRRTAERCAARRPIAVARQRCRQCTICGSTGCDRGRCRKRVGVPKPSGCKQCEGLTHRRPTVGVCRCGEPWAAEGATR